jgi:hypothetical protein
MPTRSICLQFGDEVDPVVRSRMAYALRVFAAIYGYCVVAEGESAEICCTYGERNAQVRHAREVRIPAQYKTRVRSAKTPILQKIHYANEDFHLVHGVDKRTGNPDWLGEIFEWLSASLELAIVEKDAAGRIPYSATVFHQQRISPFKPYAGLLMGWMENVLRGNTRAEALPKAKSPVPGAEHLVVCSHDIDFYFTNRAQAFRRLSKNMLISLLVYRSPSFFFSNVKMAARLLRGERVGSYLSGMLDAIESQGFRSTLFAVAQGKHRRDPDYRIEQIVPQLREAVGRGFGVGVHASYNSIVEAGTLANEARTLGDTMGRKPLGSRQHWLRFDQHDRLYRGLHEAGLAYDSSLGFSETCGFRNGANFAFPPYDFENERPCSFLEIPLVIMDGSLQQASQTWREDPQELADGILNESRKLGWGGISVLWHNPMEAIQVPEEINKVFWRSAQKQSQYGEKWMSAEEFMKASLSRYQRAGLLKEVHFDA